MRGLLYRLVRPLVSTFPTTPGYPKSSEWWALAILFKNGMLGRTASGLTYPSATARHRSRRSRTSADQIFAVENPETLGAAGTETLGT